MPLFNRTPHAITIVRGRKRVELPAPPASQVARVEERSVQVGTVEVDGLLVPIVRQEWGDITGLPAPAPGVFHIVSRVVAAAACCSSRGGCDLYVPGELRRGSDGRVNGCGGLAWASASLPGLSEVACG